MAEPIVFVESFRVLPGKSEEVRQAIAKVCAIVEAQEPELIAYKIYLNDDDSDGTVLQIHSDGASVAHHRSVAGPLMGLLMVDLIELVRIDVCGELPESDIQRIRATAEAFSGVSVVIHQSQTGFVRRP